MTASQAGRPGLGAVPPSVLVLCGALSVQFGAGLAKGMFGRVPASVLVVMRLLVLALVAGFLARRALRRVLSEHTAADLGVAAGLGLSLALMNFSIYQSIQRIPLGVAVTFEFLGPLLVSVVGSRRPLDLLWAALAFGGVVSLSHDDGGGTVTLPGVLWALLAAAGWASYIGFNAATGRRFPGSTGLALASGVATLAVLPTGLHALAGAGGAGVLTPEVLALGLAVGLLSSVIPYTFELEALRRIPQRVFGILMSSEPALAALAGVLLLGEVLSLAQWAAMGAVVVACAGATVTAGRGAKT